MENKKLTRSRTNRMVAGVCGGLADYFGVEAIIVRVVFVALVFADGLGLLLYLLLWIFVPEDTKNETIVEGHAPARTDRRRMFGIAIIVFGVLFLLNQVLPYHWLRWNIFWPMVLVAVGALILFRKR